MSRYVTDEPSVTELNGATPCGRWAMDAPSDDSNPCLYSDKAAWMYAAQLRIRVEQEADTVADILAAPGFEFAG
jgi:hypothetical protein